MNVNLKLVWYNIAIRWKKSREGLICNRLLDYMFIFATPNQTHIRYKERRDMMMVYVLEKAFFSCCIFVVVKSSICWCLSYLLCVANFNMTSNVIFTLLHTENVYIRLKHRVHLYVCGQRLGWSKQLQSFRNKQNI